MPRPPFRGIRRQGAENRRQGAVSGILGVDLPALIFFLRFRFSLLQVQDNGVYWRMPVRGIRNGGGISPEDLMAPSQWVRATRWYTGQPEE